MNNINCINKKIETIMTSSEKSKSLLLEFLIFVTSFSYGGAVRLREMFYDKGVLRSKRLPCKVISVGNLTVGGTGKTPMTIYVTRLVKRLGCKVAIVSRGYKGGAEKTGGIVSDGRAIFMTPDEAGDEPFMMAAKMRDIPVIVGQNRFKVGMMAVREFDPDVIVLDDAFQHLKIRRDIDLVLLDDNNPFGNGHLFPKGTLREPISSIFRGDAVILTRSDFIKTGSMVKLKAMMKNKPIFQSTHVPYIHKIIEVNNASLHVGSRSLFSSNFDIFSGKKVFAFSGIARNDDFRRTVESFKCEITGFAGFPDHHEYTDRELDAIVNSALDQSTDFIFTTEKDYARLAHRIKWPIDLVVIGIEISFGEDESAFKSFIKSRLEGFKK
jgi:tetraacyldisaccharide 4'-kinase